MNSYFSKLRVDRPPHFYIKATDKGYYVITMLMKLYTPFKLLDFDEDAQMMTVAYEDEVIEVSCQELLTGLLPPVLFSNHVKHLRSYHRVVNVAYYVRSEWSKRTVYLRELAKRKEEEAASGMLPTHVLLPSATVSGGRTATTYTRPGANDAPNAKKFIGQAPIDLAIEYTMYRSRVLKDKTVQPYDIETLWQKQG